MRTPEAAGAVAAHPHPHPHPHDELLVSRVQEVLRGYLALRRPEADTVHPAFAASCDALIDFVLLGGKRVRPTFAWWGWRGAGGEPDGPGAEAVLRAISALELLQASALVHDDMIDASRTRRGRPTLHVRFTEGPPGRDHPGDAARVGWATALLLGDLALCWADDMLAGAELAEDARRGAREVWAAMRTELVGGQFLDIAGPALGGPAEQLALRVDRFKTAAYTVERPLCLGAALARAPEPLVAAYRGFGADVGIAFQLRDDLLGVFGDPAVTGKPAGDDLREGKRTLLVALAERAADERGARSAGDALAAALGDPDLGEQGVERVRGILVELGAVAEVERRIERLTRSGLDALAGADVAPPADTRLPELAAAATRRRA